MDAIAPGRFSWGEAGRRSTDSALWASDLRIDSRPSALDAWSARRGPHWPADRRRPGGIPEFPRRLHCCGNDGRRGALSLDDIQLQYCEGVALGALRLYSGVARSLGELESCSS